MLCTNSYSHCTIIILLLSPILLFKRKLLLLLFLLFSVQKTITTSIIIYSPLNLRYLAPPKWIVFVKAGLRRGRWDVDWFIVTQTNPVSQFRLRKLHLSCVLHQLVSSQLSIKQTCLKFEGTVYLCWFTR